MKSGASWVGPLAGMLISMEDAVASARYKTRQITHDVSKAG